MSSGTVSYKIYLADIRPLLDKNLQRAVYERLPLNRQRKADACRVPKARAASLAAGFLMEYALKEQGAADCRINYTSQGAPAVQCAVQSGRRTLENAEQARWYLSVSHSGDYAACVISDRPVGVDIQQLVPVRKVVLKHFFREAEREKFLRRYRELPDDRFLSEEAANDFLRQWAAKESYMKFTGQGMSIGFDRIYVHRDADNNIVRLSDLKRVYGSVRVLEYQIPGGYCLSVCI